jgi:DNA-binding response OmpR family regulator
VSARVDAPGDDAAGDDARRAAARIALVVDDYPAVLAWAARALARAGWGVLTADDAGGALARWAEARAAGTPVGVLVTDLGVSGVDGATLARRLRLHDPALPVLAVHAGAAARAAWDGPSLERVAFLEKPVRAADLVAAADALVGSGHGAPSPTSRRSSARATRTPTDAA